MIVEKYCDRCGMEYDWIGVQQGDLIFCCQGCANGTGCTCVFDGSETETTVVEDDVVIVERPLI